MYRLISSILLFLASCGCLQPERVTEIGLAKKNRLQPPEVVETRLLGKTKLGWLDGVGTADWFTGALGSELFVYGLDNQTREAGGDLYRIEGEKVVPLQLHISSGEISRVNLSKDDSRIVFLTSGPTGHTPSIIYSVGADGAHLIKLVESEGECGEKAKKILPGDGMPYCNYPSRPRISPDGQKVLFIEYVLDVDEERQTVSQPEYLCVVSTEGGPVVRLEESSHMGGAEWSEDGASIYYVADSILRRFDLETGSSQPLTDNSWKVRWTSPLRVSPADGSLYFNSQSGFARLDPDTGSAEVLSGRRLDAFELSPDGCKIVGVTVDITDAFGVTCDITIIDRKNRFTSPLQMRRGAKDELGLEPILACRSSTQAQTSTLAVSKRNAGNWVAAIHWLDETRLWVLLVENSLFEYRVGIIELAN